MQKDIIEDLNKRHMFSDFKCMMRFLEHQDTYFRIGVNTIIAKATMNGEYATKFMQNKDKCEFYDQAVKKVNNQLMR